MNQTLIMSSLGCSKNQTHVGVLRKSKTITRENSALVLLAVTQAIESAYPQFVVVFDPHVFFGRFVSAREESREQQAGCDDRRRRSHATRRKEGHHSNMH